MNPATEVVVIFGAAVRADGSPSGALQRRIDAAVEYARGRNVVFVVSGGVGRHPPAEATLMAAMLRARGVPDGDIVQEAQSKTTVETIVNCTAIVRGMTGITRIMACSDAYHLPRCRWLFRLNGLKAGGIAAADGRRANSPQKWLWFHLREILAIAKDTVIILAHRMTAGASRPFSS